ncbi:MAG: ABC transporter ATP-binding protein [Candidatus Methanomethylicaceae archaeon]
MRNIVCSIIIDKITVRFDSSTILDNIEFVVNKGEMLGIIGPNGSGKTTLLRCIARSIIPIGSLIVLGKPANKYTNEEYSKIVSAMLPNWPNGFSMKAYEVVLMGCRNRINGIWWEGDEDIKVVEDVLSLLEVSHLFNRDFDTLSSGEQRKILVAKSLAQKTDIIILDEPVAYLDLKHKIEVMDILKALTELGKTVIVSLHEIELACNYCDKILVLNKGKIVAFGKPRDVINENLLSEVYGIEATIKWDGDNPIIIPKTRKIKSEEVICLK